MWSITITSNTTGEETTYKETTIPRLINKYISNNPFLNNWLNEETIRNIRLGRRKEYAKWVKIVRVLDKHHHQQKSPQLTS